MSSALLSLAWLSLSMDALGGYAQAPPDLTLRLAPGDEVVHELRQSFFELGSSEPDTVYVFERRSVVFAREQSRYTLETSTRFVESWEAGVRLPAPKASRPVERVERVDSGGRALDSVDPLLDPVEVRLERLTRFVAPTPGDSRADTAAWSWRHEVADRPGIPAADFFGRYVGRATFTGRDCAKVRIVVKEQANSGIAGEGEALVDVSTGVPVKWELRVRNAPLPGGTGETFEVKIELVARSLRVGGKELLKSTAQSPQPCTTASSADLPTVRSIKGSK